MHIGKYEVLTKLSVGGMAELYLAYTAGPGGFRKFVAVKRVRSDVGGDDEELVELFLDEARITAGFNHPHIAQVYDLIEGPEGFHLVMEFISGQNLRQVEAACRALRRPVPLGFTLRVVHDACLALHYAHQFTTATGRPRPVIHRDVAHKNIMVTHDGVTKLLDFGIAKVRGALHSTGVGMVRGTLGYMSPEQLQGKPLDGRTDLYAAGVVLHELLSGHPLFVVENELDTMRNILGAPVLAPVHAEEPVSRALAEVALRALARDKQQRFGTGREMAKALEQASEGRMFDQDQCSELMHRLFSDRIAATRALLQATTAEEATETLRRSANPFAEAETTERAAHPSPPPRAPRRPSGVKPPAQPGRSAVDEVTLPPAAGRAPRPTDEPAPHAPPIFRYAIAVMLALAVAAFIAYRFLEERQAQKNQLRPFGDAPSRSRAPAAPSHRSDQATAPQEP